MPQDNVPGYPRTEAEKASFDHMLGNVNFLYLGCKVCSSSAHQPAQSVSHSPSAS